MPRRWRTGLHGANRLASNSLLEAVSFAAHAAERIRERLAESPSDARLPIWDPGDATDSDEDESIVHDLLKAQLMTPLTEMHDETVKRKAAAHEAYTVGKVAVSMDDVDETEGFRAMLDRATRLDLNPMYPIIDYTEEAEGSGDEDEEIVAKYVAAGIAAEEDGPEASEEGTEDQ